MKPKPEKPKAFYQHLVAAGSISRSNPELVRLADVTGFNLEHLFKVATGQRLPSLPCVKALVANAGNRAVTEDSFQVAGR